ncbi:MAG: UPF0434 protein [Candidatus Sumerlaea sp.]|jgi:uncharacterized protein YbaR (Trm112 family)|uniref:UPF0434 protein BRCON_1784 n=1 Tax=Sumerlaea chitinivorans TaxID=2250252 RepID=A0A2Z4Y5Q7_SUMC1|nr:protein of unknown function DUF343 [Candidatus Sumerlaea chitinivorans]MCX7963000.1 Trm112 family protein [Candidatus Sumerlaea chitinivorans]GIX45524.1 MAG: UPF0434 protein [Candidatus Sumerlaea sp.]
MLSKDFLDILACPKCKGELEYRQTADGKGDALICRACKLRYEIVDDIPNLLIEEAKPLQEGE